MKEFVLKVNCKKNKTLCKTYHVFLRGESASALNEGEFSVIDSETE